LEPAPQIDPIPGLEEDFVKKACFMMAIAMAFAGCSSPGSGVSAPTSPGAVARVDTPPEPDPCEGSSTAVLTDPAGCGRFTGGGFQVNASGIKVTRGFTLHCDAILSNNLEVNWDGGNNFKMYKNPTDVVCTFISDPNPPDAPVNKIVINGFGSLNGTENVAFSIALVDNGEKAGAPADQAYISIGGVNLTGGSAASPLPIDGGNIQAHEDQPHRR
jgi:hypothetical protein